MMQKLMIIVLGLLLAGCGSIDQSTRIAVGQANPEPGSYAHAQQVLSQRLAVEPVAGPAKNVILFIGDGMGISTITAARIYAGQKQGQAGEEHIQVIESLPHTALVKTYNTNQQVSDSAGTATAIMTGLKTRAGVIGIGPQARRGDCAAAQQNKLESLAETAEKYGFATGIVSTARLTHATPAAVYAHSPERGWEADNQLPPDAVSAGCLSIARQLIEFNAGNGIDVALGGGRAGFVSNANENLLEKWPGTVISTADELMALTPTDENRVLGVFADSHMTFERLKQQDSTEPTLAQMTAKAIDILSNRDRGYFLMVESGRIDHGHHAGRAELALEEAYHFDQAVKAALDKIDLSNTLVLVTADHSHVFTIAGYPTRGNPILGVVQGNDASGEPRNAPALAQDDLAYTTLGYHNGPGAYEGNRNPQRDSDEVILQQAVIPMPTETHGGEDVAVFAAGPYAHLIGGVIEQNVLYHIMRHALGLPQ